ncbi:MAG: asparaginase [uncultured Sulfurovum sp.]|uniref:Asparaginase n=1 Tax=uncultured Sulfurovum sp. TaxID=269237 RepID=A0A6S6S9R0_9BACT|nr:MAG: asparaginase [uncultured Sulfurovum sp.]
MKKILIINTGGTFNKIYNPLTGNLDIEPKGKAIKSIAKAWLTNLTIKNIIGKDSLDMTGEDRKIIKETIQKAKEKNIIIVHGTDTMDKTARYLDKAKLGKKIILTGAMVPHSINPIESTSNLCSSYGFLNVSKEKGVFISMNGIIKDYKRVVKNKEKGYFEKSKY